MQLTVRSSPAQPNPKIYGRCHQTTVKHARAHMSTVTGGIDSLNAEMTEEEFETNGCICDAGTPVIGEQLVCRREDSNPHDRYAIAVLKCKEIVGHVPWYMSTACSLFMR